MAAELARKRKGKKTQTGMSESQLSDFATTKGVPERNKKRSVMDDKKKNKFAKAFEKRFGKNAAKKTEDGKPLPKRPPGKK